MGVNNRYLGEIENSLVVIRHGVDIGLEYRQMLLMVGLRSFKIADGLVACWVLKHQHPPVLPDSYEFRPRISPGIAAAFLPAFLSTQLRKHRLFFRLKLINRDINN